MISPPSSMVHTGLAPMAGNKLEGDWGEIVALGAEISPLKEPREKWSLPKKKKKKKKNFFFFFFFFFNFHLSLSDNHVSVEIN